LELVESFTYLGSTITWDGRSRSDFKHWIAQAKMAFMTIRPLLCSKSICRETRKKHSNGQWPSTDQKHGLLEKQIRKE
jgi:hypothetical protein